MPQKLQHSPSNVNGLGRIEPWLFDLIPQLTPTELRILVVVAFRCGQKNACRVTTQELALMTGAHRNQINQAMSAMCERGVIEVFRELGCPSVRLKMHGNSAHVPHGKRAYEPGSSSLNAGKDSTETVQEVSHARSSASPHTLPITHTNGSDDAPGIARANVFKNKEDLNYLEGDGGTGEEGTLMLKMHGKRASVPHQTQVLTLVHPEGGEPETLMRLWETWKRETGHPGAKLTQPRRVVLLRALKDHGLEIAELAIRGIATSDWHMGRDPETHGKRYDGPEYVFRPRNVENFIQAGKRILEPAEDLTPYDQLHHEWRDLEQEFFVVRGNPTVWADEVDPQTLKFRSELMPDGKTVVHGQTVYVWSEVPTLTMLQLSDCSAKWAGKKLVERHPKSEAAKCIDDDFRRDAHRMLTAEYNRLCVLLDKGVDITKPREVEANGDSRTNS